MDETLNNWSYDGSRTAKENAEDLHKSTRYQLPINFCLRVCRASLEALKYQKIIREVTYIDQRQVQP